MHMLYLDYYTFIQALSQILTKPRQTKDTENLWEQVIGDPESSYIENNVRSLELRVE